MSTLYRLLTAEDSSAFCHKITDALARTWAKALISIENEHKVGGRLIEGIISGCRKIIAPIKLIHLRTKSPSDFDGLVRTPCIDHNDFIDEFAGKGEAIAQKHLFVADDHA